MWQAGGAHLVHQFDCPGRIGVAAQQLSYLGGLGRRTAGPGTSEPLRASCGSRSLSSSDSTAPMTPTSIGLDPISYPISTVRRRCWPICYAWRTRSSRTLLRTERLRVEARRAVLIDVHDLVKSYNVHWCLVQVEDRRGTTEIVHA